MKTININQDVKDFSIKNLVGTADAISIIISGTSMGSGTGIRIP